jgi:hypothetical protein
MQIFAIIIAGRYGPQPYPGPYVIGFFIIIAIVCFISSIVNRKELDQIKKDAKAIKELPKVDGKPWKCPKCGEILEPQFDSCWKCGAKLKKNDHAA